MSPADNRFYRTIADPEMEQAVGHAKERRAIATWLCGGGERIRGQWYPWDSEMIGYYRALADRIEHGDHTPKEPNQ